MWFWIRKLILGSILIGAAAYLLFFERAFEGVEFNFETKAPAGLEKFYENIRAPLYGDNQGPDSEFVVKLPPPRATLEKSLQTREQQVSAPAPKNFKGENKERKFDSGQTLKSVMSKYAQQEGLAFYWYLSRDYVIKHDFKVSDDFLSTLHQVGSAIDSDFSEPVIAFFCPKQRAAIITNKPDNFVKKSCKQTKL